MERNYQDLALQQNQLDEYLSTYLEINQKVTIRSDDSSPSKRTIKLGYVGVDDATIILFFKNTGTTTIQFKTGKNHDLGKTLADYLYETIDPSESISVNLSVKGVDAADVEQLIDDLSCCSDENQQLEFTITTHRKNNNSTKFEIVSNNYKDRLVVTHHNTTNVLQVQGRRLFTYRNLSYSLSILLDQESLLAVVSCSSSEDKLVVREEVARLYIEQLYEKSFPKMQEIYKRLLISSYCVKLASPNLPEYSMLLYADLRVLEGVIKEVLALYNMFTNGNRLDIGEYFDCTRDSSSIKNEHLSAFECSGIIGALESCYQLYREQRHSLFHMSDFAAASRTVSTLGEAMNLSIDISSRIELLYQSCKRI